MTYSANLPRVNHKASVGAKHSVGANGHSPVPGRMAIRPYNA
ncbi:hypothetical protein [Planktothricoides raciborskii]|uniref:Uncharacterized protein n=1 Tax=Planktothricoides raciborskii GIHE-MW2 TaxID=2792601 RepID=A0AAU8JKP9_9CYAN